ncbi:hypothetical protein GOP47_0024109 [Adiantum capillus-veneris]|uniref:Uncharacterized protein n=1 Tax=Adiantum capillus-veneris TaxID=13818 RepID=A0A9D4U6W6_ADICA|nr:hypothetical protein GOP47_0024109 [Adiantum capillus-veneris]
MEAEAAASHARHDHLLNTAADPSSRSLPWTLTAAAITYALLVSTSWAIGIRHARLGDKSTFLDRLLWNAFNALFTPAETIQYMLYQALMLLLVRGSYLSKGQPLFPHLDIAMNHLILSSYWFIEVPPSQDPGPHLRRYLVDGDSDSLINALHPLELTPAINASAGHFGQANTPLQYALPDYGNQPRQCLLLPAPIFLGDESVQEREALLMCGFQALQQVPELSSMDERARLSPLRVLAMVLQAGGYALGVVERWKRGLGVSPLEAMVCMFCVPMLIQVLLEPAAARLTHERPLLLRLQPSQFTMFRDLPRSPVDREQLHRGIISQFFILFALLCCGYLLLPILTLYFTFRYYWQSCGLCSLSTLLLFLLCTFQYYVLTLLPLVAPNYDLGHDLEALADVDGPQRRPLVDLLRTPLFIISLCHMLMIFLTITLTIWSTIEHWSSFHTPTKPNIAWLLPHFGA